MDDTEILESLTKSAGFVEEQRIRCGKANCRCSQSKEYWHGPYYSYRFWKLENGRYYQKKLYINHDTYNRLKVVLDYYHTEIAGSHGTYQVDRQSTKALLLNGGEISREGLDAFRVKVKDVLSMIPNF